MCVCIRLTNKNARLLLWIFLVWAFTLHPHLNYAAPLFCKQLCLQTRLCFHHFGVLSVDLHWFPAHLPQPQPLTVKPNLNPNLTPRPAENFVFVPSGRGAPSKRVCKHIHVPTKWVINAGTQACTSWSASFRMNNWTLRSSAGHRGSCVFVCMCGF